MVLLRRTIFAAAHMEQRDMPSLLECLAKHVMGKVAALGGSDKELLVVVKVLYD